MSKITDSKFDPKHIPDYDKYVQLILRKEHRSFRLWKVWLSTYGLLRSCVQTQESTTFNLVYEKYAIEDPKYVEHRFFYGVVPKYTSLLSFFTEFEEFRQYIGLYGTGIPFFSIYPSCLQSNEYVSILSPFRGSAASKYIGHLAIPLKELQDNGIFNFNSLRKKTVQHVTSIQVDNFVYFPNERSNIFGELD